MSAGTAHNLGPELEWHDNKPNSSFPRKLRILSKYEERSPPPRDDNLKAVPFGQVLICESPLPLDSKNITTSKGLSAPLGAFSHTDAHNTE